MKSSDANAFKDALRAEYAAIFGYGLVSAYASPTRNAAIAKVWSAHRVRRDRLFTLLHDNGETPPSAEVSYTTSMDVWNPLTAAQLATHLEDDCAIAWGRALATLSESRYRKIAVQALLSCSEWSSRWRIAAGTVPATYPLPGVREPRSTEFREQQAGTRPARQRPSLSSSTTSTTEKETTPSPDTDSPDAGILTTTTTPSSSSTVTPSRDGSSSQNSNARNWSPADTPRNNNGQPSEEPAIM